VLLQLPHLLQFMPRYQSHGSCSTNAATAPTFYVSSSFDEDKAQSSTGIVEWLDYYWIRVLCLLTYHQGCSGAASWTHTDARSICIDEYLLKRWRSLPRLKLLLSQYHFSSLICSDLQCCYSSRIAVRAVVDTVNILAVQVLLT
jgi:hypothetical protein